MNLLSKLWPNGLRVGPRFKNAIYDLKLKVIVKAVGLARYPASGRYAWKSKSALFEFDDKNRISIKDADDFGLIWPISDKNQPMFDLNVRISLILDFLIEIQLISN